MPSSHRSILSPFSLQVSILDVCERRDDGKYKLISLTAYSSDVLHVFSSRVNKERTQVNIYYTFIVIHVIIHLKINIINSIILFHSIQFNIHKFKHVLCIEHAHLRIMLFTKHASDQIKRFKGTRIIKCEVTSRYVTHIQASKIRDRFSS